MIFRIIGNTANSNKAQTPKRRNVIDNDGDSDDYDDDDESAF
jgi:hypothetical protein